jgi:hypothetical protein
MGFKKENIKKDGSLAIIVDGIQLNEILDSSFLKFLDEKYSDNFNIHATEIVFRFTPKEVEKFESQFEPKKEGKGIVLNLTLDLGPYIKLEHTGPKDFDEKKAVLRSSNFDLIDRFIGKKKE